MNIPTNGRVIILDDKIEQAKALFKALSKNKIPFTYHSDSEDQFPLTPYNDVRLIFIDINLTDGTNEQSIQSQLQKTLKQLIKPNTIYIAAIWSLKEHEYQDLLDNLFDNLIPDLKPILRISLSKSRLFTIDPENGSYIEDPFIDLITEINNKLELEMQNILSLKAIIKWENIIDKCSSETITHFSSIVERDDFWNNNMRHVLYKMAHAQLGKNLLESSEKSIVQSSLQTLNSSFIDKIEDELNSSKDMPEDMEMKINGVSYTKKIGGILVDFRWENLDNYVFFFDGREKTKGKNLDKIKGATPNDNSIINSFKSQYKLISPKINYELVFNKVATSEIFPGNIYYIPVSGKKKRKLLTTYFNTLKRKISNDKTEDADISKFKFIELECTPMCDYSQRKWLRSRILPGVMFPSEYSYDIKSSDSLYSEIPDFYHDGEIMRLVFDYRLFRSLNLLDKHDKKKIIFKLKKSILIDIQARLSSHVNRPGITTLK